MDTYNEKEIIALDKCLKCDFQNLYLKPFRHALRVAPHTSQRIADLARRDVNEQGRKVFQSSNYIRKQQKDG